MFTRRALMTTAALMAADIATRRWANAQPPATTAFTNARWFDGSKFIAREGWSVDGRFTFQKPVHVGTTVDLAGAYLVPPYADAHNHGIGTGVESRDRSMVSRYLNDGVFHAQIMGNGPLSPEDREKLGIGPAGLEVTFAQGSITGHGGHPMGLLRNVLLPQGYFAGRTMETLSDWRFFEVGSEAELEAKWPKIRTARGDFIKFFLFCSDEFTKRANDEAFFGRRGLDPKLAASVVKLAHRDGLRAAAHVVNVADFRVALDAGVDIIAHLPTDGVLTEADVQRAAKLSVPVITTCGFLTRLARNDARQSAEIAARQTPNLRLLKQAGARVVIGSDDPSDTTHGELAHLRKMGVFTDAELLAMWTRDTPRSIHPGRKIGALEQDHEASFVALKGDPLADWSATQRIQLRVKRGLVVQATSTAGV